MEPMANMQVTSKLYKTRYSRLWGKVGAVFSKTSASDNTLLDQLWIMDTKKKVSQIIKEYSDGSEIKVLDFVRYKVGEGID